MGKQKEPQGMTLPSVGLMAPGKLSHGSVQPGQGWGAKTASIPFSYTHMYNIQVTIQTFSKTLHCANKMVTMKWFQESHFWPCPLQPCAHRFAAIKTKQNFLCTLLVCSDRTNLSQIQSTFHCINSTLEQGWKIILKQIETNLFSGYAETK